VLIYMKENLNVFWGAEGTSSHKHMS
jgi:hypothetical protein